MAGVVGIRGQGSLTTLYRADGSTLAARPKIVLPNFGPRSSFVFENISDTAMYLEFGGARATATLTNGAVSSCTIVNAGFNYTLPPRVTFLGGGRYPNGLMQGVAYPGAVAPSNIATGHCVMTDDGYGTTTNKVSSIVIDNGGSGYASAPLVVLLNDPNDPFGCADPSLSSGTGFLVYPANMPPQTPLVAPTDAVAVWANADSKKFFCGYTI